MPLPPRPPDAPLARITPPRPGELAPLTRDLIKQIVDDFFNTQSPYTRAGYAQDMKRFCAYQGLADATAFGRWLTTVTPGKANSVALNYRQFLAREGGRKGPDGKPRPAAPATINRRLAALRSFVKLAQRSELIPWTLSVDSVPSGLSRNVEGPSLEAVNALLDAAAKQPAALAARDVALITVLYSTAVRSIEVRELELADFDLKRKCIRVRGKGEAERTPMTLPPDALDAVVRWLTFRGTAPGALFTDVRPSGRITLTALTRYKFWESVKRVGKLANVDVHPHGFRHTAATEALWATDGNTRAVQKLTRHKRAETLDLYEDRRRDVAGELSAKLMERLKAARRVEKKP